MLHGTHTGIGYHFSYPTDIVSRFEVNISVHAPSGGPLILHNPISFLHIDPTSTQQGKKDGGSLISIGVRIKVEEMVIELEF